MIHSIKLENFQKHSRRQIDLDPNITVVVGPTDSGKSSLIRSLGWVAFNKPDGLAFIKDGAKGCTVSITNDNGTVKRRRSKKTNQYEVNGVKLDAIRRSDVPTDVQDVLRLHRLNFQFQHDAPLWLSDSPGDVAKELNKLVNLDLIDRVLNRLGRQFKVADTEVTVSENRLNRANSDKAKLEWVEQAESEYKVIEDVQTKLQQLQTRSTQLDYLVGQVMKVENRIELLGSIVEPMSAGLDEIEKIQRQIKQLEKMQSVFNRLLGQIEDSSEDVKDLESRVKKAEDELVKIKVCPVCGKGMK